MDYENFKEQFVADVEAKLAEQGADVTISVNEVKKLNDNYDALTITPNGSNIGANIAINRFYDAMEDGIPYDKVVDKAVETAIKGLENRPDIDIAVLSDYSQMREKLEMELVSVEANRELLETVPHQIIEDMAVVYRFVLSSEEENRATILATYRNLENMGATPEQLYADAAVIAPRNKPAEIKGMSEVMAEMMGLDQAQMFGIVPVSPEDEQMFVASVPDKFHGAAVLAYEGFLDAAAEKLGGDFFVLPSSIHEILLVPDKGQMEFKELENMVREVNATQVAPDEKLTDNVYHYDSESKVFELAEKYVERIAA